MAMIDRIDQRGWSAVESAIETVYSMKHGSHVTEHHANYLSGDCLFTVQAGSGEHLSLREESETCETQVGNLWLHVKLSRNATQESQQQLVTGSTVQCLDWTTKTHIIFCNAQDTQVHKQPF